MGAGGELIRYKIKECRDHPGEWRVEGVDRKTGEVYIAIFEAGLARERAEKYLAWIRAVSREEG